jgi:cell division protein FtsQ
MKKPSWLRWEARKNRIKRNAGAVLREIGQVILLMGAIAAITTVLLVAYDSILRSPQLSVREIVVKGCKELTEKDVLALASVHTAPNILTLNLDAVARRIRSNPWIQEVSIGREFPDRLVIIVRERRAVALLQKEGELQLLDDDGAAFKRLEPGDDGNLPILTGCVRAGKTDELLVKKSLALLHYLASVGDAPALGTVSEVHGNETFGLSVFTDTGLCLQMGFDGYEEKINRLNPVMADLDRRNLKRGFLLIDLSEPGKINVQQRSILAPPGQGGAAKSGKRYRM